jgi:hypothetical protein
MTYKAIITSLDGQKTLLDTTITDPEVDPLIDLLIANMRYSARQGNIANTATITAKSIDWKDQSAFLFIRKDTK